MLRETPNGRDAKSQPEPIHTGLHNRIESLPVSPQVNKCSIASARVLPPTSEKSIRTLPNDEHTQLYFSRGVLSRACEQVRLSPLGRGVFATVYLEVGGEGRVFAFTRGPGHGKEVVAEVHLALPENPHVPHVRHFGRTRTEDVWAMPYYRTSFHRRESAQAWALYELLRASVDDARQATDGRGKNLIFNYYAVNRARERGVPEPALRAFEALARTAAEHSYDYVFEVNRPNVGLDKEGTLVLLDVLFNERELRLRRRR